MLKHLLGNYLVSAMRSLMRHKMNLVLTLLGLSIGLAATMLVSLYAINESSYDEFQPDAERTYRVIFKNVSSGYQHPLTTPRGNQHLKKIPGVEDALTLISTHFIWDGKIQIGSEHFKLDNVMTAAENFTDFINIDVLHGELKEALTQPSKIALSRSEALRLFGTVNAVGESFLVISTNRSMEVVAVFDDFYDNSHYAMKSIASNQRFMEIFGRVAFNYIKLEEGTNADTVSSEATKIFNELWQDESNNTVFLLQPLTDIHLSPNLEADMKVGGSEKTVIISIALSILLVLISSFNYINMNVAQAGLRAKEVGVRQVLGATRLQLVIQFLTESIVVTLFSALLACALVELFLPSFNQLVSRELIILSWFDYMLPIIALTLVIGVFSGMYPALFISSFNVQRVLSGDFGRGKTAIIVRKSLMVFQSGLSVALIVAAASLYLQLEHLQNLAVNYEKEQRIRITGLPDERIYDVNDQLLYQDLSKIDGVISATPTDFDFTKSTNAGALVTSVPKVADLSVSMGHSGVGFNAAKTLGLQLVAGRDFSPQYQTDWFNQEELTVGILIPESVLLSTGYKNAEEAIGDVWRFNAGPNSNIQGKIVGVFKDVKLGSSREASSPVLFACGLPIGGDSMVVEVADQTSSKMRQDVINFVEKRLNVNAVEIQLVRDSYAKLYQPEDRLVSMVSIFSGLAVFLTCIGMFGLAAFSAQQRSREVAIRKVLGASRFGLTALLTRESFVLVVISLIIAFPTAYILVGDWLNNFNDRITQSFGIYLISASFVALVTWLTVASIAFRTASIRPSNSLRCE